MICSQDGKNYRKKAAACAAWPPGDGRNVLAAWASMADLDATVSLDLTEVVKDFGGMRALAGTSINIKTNEIVGLIGPNGSGKTTLLNIASGVLSPTSGSVTVGGSHPIRGKSHRFARRGIGRTFQQIRLFEEMTVEENVRVGAIARGEHDADWQALMDHLQLTDLRHQRAVTLPYGTQRKVEIARALAGRPQFLLLDEPAAGMNEAETDALLDIINSIKTDYQTAILIVEHDLGFIMRLCERIYVLAEGRVIFDGSPSGAQKDPAVIEAYLGTPSPAEETDNQTATGIT